MVVGGGGGHIWTAPQRIVGDRIEARLVNAPVYFQGRPGDPIGFDAAQVSDWSFWQGDKLHGNYTTRVMLPDIPPGEAAQLRAILAPLPQE